MSSTVPQSKTLAPRLALTPGEPAGVGPDLAVLVATQRGHGAIVCIADPALLHARARKLGLEVEIEEVDAADVAPDPKPGVVRVHPTPLAVAASPGTLDPANARYVLNCLDIAVDLCHNGVLDAMVTGPVQKSVINDAGIRFSGHTEYLAQRLGRTAPVMMLVAHDLRVALVTTHIPLVEVPASITSAQVRHTTEVVAAALVELFGIEQPRLCVCGLNPHGGEGGYLGDEEITTISPALDELRARGMSIVGPLPADTAFTQENRGRYDAFVAMYHDQGLPVLKSLGFGNAVNLTLDLPIVRTSVDHGTALALAGGGEVDCRSLQAALRLAASLALTRRQHGT